MVLCVALTACGRIGFTDIDSANTGVDASTDAPPPSCMTCEQGLVARWSFDEGTGNVANADVGGYQGTASTGTTWTTGPRGSAIEFDDGFIDTTLDLVAAAPSGQFTVAMWIRQAPANVEFDRFFSMYFWDGSDNGALLLDNSLGQGVRCAANLQTSWPYLEIENVIGVGTWHHIACLYDGSRFKIFVDGASKKEFAIPGRSLRTTGGFPTLIGASRSGPQTQNEMSGALDDVRFYDRGLTPAELASLATP